MRKYIPCPACNGYGLIVRVSYKNYGGSVRSKLCHHCGGRGQIEVAATNADRIRAMSDTELGVFLCSVSECSGDKCPGASCCGPGRNGCVEWLKQPVKEDE